MSKHSIGLGQAREEAMHQRVEEPRSWKHLEGAALNGENSLCNVLEDSVSKLVQEQQEAKQGFPKLTSTQQGQWKLG